MTQSSQSLGEHLKTRTTTLCNCWRLQRADGVVMGFTDHDLDIEFDNIVFYANTGMGASEIATSTGFATDNSEITSAITSDKLQISDIHAGLYDGAHIERWHVNWAQPDQRKKIETGTVGTVKNTDGEFYAEIRGAADILNDISGRRYERRCDADLGDARCGINLSTSSRTVSATIQDVLNGAILVVDGIDNFEAGFFANGTINRPANGQAITLRDHYKTAQQVIVSLWTQRDNIFSIGDAVELTVGCDKTFYTCRKRFANAVNFRGFPHIPGNDFAYSVAKDGVVHDGSPLIIDDD